MDATAIRALAQIRDAAMFPQGLPELLSGAMQANRRIIDRNAENMGLFGKGGIANVYQRKDQSIRRRFDPSRLTDATGARVPGLLFRGRLQRGDGVIHQALPVRQLAYCVRHDVAVQAIEPGQHPIRVLQRFGVLESPYRRHLQNIVHFGRWDAGANESLELVAVDV